MELLLGDVLKISICEEKDPRPNSEHDIELVDTRHFPQEILDYLDSHHDELELLGIFCEYYPFIGLSRTSEVPALLRPYLAQAKEIADMEMEMEI